MYSFADNTALTSIDLKNVESIGSCSFMSTSIAEVHIPKSVNEIINQSSLFDHATTITCAEENANFAVINNVLYNKSITKIISLPIGLTSGELHIEPTATSALYAAMKGCQATLYLNSEVQPEGGPDWRNSPKGDVIVGCEFYDFYTSGTFVQDVGSGKDFQNIKSLSKKLLHSVTATAGANGSVAIGDTTECNGVQLIATPDEHYDFVKWSNGLTTPTIRINVTKDTTITATFKKQRYDVAFYPDAAEAEDGSANFYAAANVEYGTDLTALEAEAKAKDSYVVPECYRLLGWARWPSSELYDLTEAVENANLYPIWDTNAKFTVTFINKAGGAVLDVVDEVKCHWEATPPASPTPGYKWQWDSDEWKSVTKDLVIEGLLVEEGGTGIGNTSFGAEAQKVMIDGHLFILCGEHLYDAQGKMVK